ncbi:O-antigen ligase family protein [Mammaliicoccus sciuri]
MAAKSSKYTIDKFFKVIFFIFSICIVNIILIPYIMGDLPSYINFGLLNYQNASYISAFIVGIGLYFLTESNIKYKALYLIFICLLLPVIFIAAGRGGAVLLILYILLTTVNIIVKKSIPLVNKIIIIGMVATGSITFITTAISLDDTGRTFSYITADGLDLNNTSGREDVYKSDINTIKNSPIIGYGLFNYYHLVNNIPHNIIMEILLISGVIGLSISIVICYFLFKKYVKNFEENSPDRLVGYIFLYPITMLMFSSNFLIVSELWFVIFYVLAKYKERRNV